MHHFRTGKNSKTYYNNRLNHLSANITKWSITLKQYVLKLSTNCLSVFDHFVGLALKGLKLKIGKSNSVVVVFQPNMRIFETFYIMLRIGYEQSFSITYYISVEIFFLHKSVKHKNKRKKIRTKTQSLMIHAILQPKVKRLTLGLLTSPGTK